MSRMSWIWVFLAAVVVPSAAGMAGDGSTLLLSSLSVSANGAAVPLIPAFGSVTLDGAVFAVEVGPHVQQITITPYLALPGLAVSVGSLSVDAQHPSATVSLPAGKTTSIEVRVTRAAGSGATCTISATRVSLAGLALLADGSAIPCAFSPERLTYSVTVDGTAQEILVTPAVESDELTVEVNGMPISPSEPTVAVSLVADEVTIVTIVVSGPLGTSATYELLVSRVETPLVCQPIIVVLDEAGQYALTTADIAAITGLPEMAVVAWTATPETVSCACVGDVPVLISVEGPSGSPATCTTTLHVIDNEAPVVAACPPPAGASVYASEGHELIPDLTALVRASDNCGATVMQTPAPGTVWQVGETPVELRISDASGNEAPPCETILDLRELPYWPMVGQNSGRTSASLVYGLSRPWFVSVYPESTAIQESGMRLELVPDFVLIGKAGTLFIRGRERGPQSEVVGEHLLAICPESFSLLWSFPILALAQVVPAISDDGTVYCFDEEGRLVALDPEVPAGGPRVVWSVDLSSFLPTPLAEALGRPIWEQFPGIWISCWQPILVGPSGNVYVSYRSFVFAFGPPPDRPFLWVRPVEEWAAAAAGPDGVFYTRSWREGTLAIAAIEPGGTERWGVSIPAIRGENPYFSPAASIITTGGHLILPVTADGGRHDLIALSGVDGHCLAACTLPSGGGETIALALGPQRTLFVVTEGVDQTKEGRPITLHAVRMAEGASHLELLWSVDLGTGWVDAIVVDGSETAYVSIRKRAREDHAWSDDSLLIVVREGAVRSLLPVWGRVDAVPSGGVGANLALGKGGSLYRVVDSARTNDPGGRGGALIQTVPCQDPHVSILEATPRYRAGAAPPVEFLFAVRIEDPLLRFKDLTLTWDFGDGAVETDRLDGDHAIGDRLRDVRKYHTYGSLGTFPVHVTARLDPEGLVVAEVEATACAQLPEIQEVVVLPRGAAPAFFDAAALEGQTVLRAYVDQPIEFGCRVDIACAGSEQIEWRFGDGGHAAGRTASHAYSSPRIYDVELCVGEKPLVAQKRLRVEILPLPDLLVVAEPDGYGPYGLSVRVQVELSTLPPQLLTLTLDLGDGREETRQTDCTIHTFDHVYGAPGTYSVAATLLGTDMRAETTVEYRLPPFALRIEQASGFSPHIAHLICEPILSGWPTNGLIYEWTIRNEIVDEWMSADGVIHCGLPGNEFYHRFVGVGTHPITCYIYDPNARSDLYGVCSGIVRILPLPEPDGIRVPFLKDPGIPSGSKCRWACGGDCPDSCVDHDDVIVWAPDPIGGGYYKLTYSGVISCGTHEGCRWHDDCFDMCAQHYGESDWWEHCHMHCNAVVADRYPVLVTSDGIEVLPWISWQGGGGPYDGWFLYSDPPTAEGPFPTPRNEP